MNFDIKKEDIFSIAAVAGFVVLILLIVALCKPLVESIQQNKEQRQAYIRETEALKKTLALASKKQFIHLTSPSQLNQFRDQISLIAKTNKIEFRFKTVSNEAVDASSDPYNRLPLEAEATGKLSDFGRFLSDLKIMPDGVVDIIKLVISNQGTSQSSIAAQMTLGVYMAKDNEN